MQPLARHRKVAPTPPSPPASSSLHHHIAAAISNSDDLAPFIRASFTTSKPDNLLQLLRQFLRSKTLEIESLCSSHSHDFLAALDDLRLLLHSSLPLKSSLESTSSTLSTSALPLLSSLDELIVANKVRSNLMLCVDHIVTCVRVLEVCDRVNRYLKEGNLYMALRCCERIEREWIESVPLGTMRRMLERKCGEIRVYAERRTEREVGDWLVEIRVVSRGLGQVAIARASEERQREEEMRMKQREAEEQARGSVRDYRSYNYTLEVGYEEGEDEDEGLGFDLTRLYRAYHIHRSLGFEDRFKKYYFENRKLQLTSDFQVSSMMPFLESHQTFFAQIAGFFIVEDKVMRTGRGLISRWQVDNMWEMAVSKMCSVLEDQFSRMQTASHLLLIKDYVSLLGVSLRRYGYPVDALLDVLSKHRDKYHDLLLSDCRKQISDALAGDKFEQMLMRKEYEYSMHVLAFQLQSSDIVPAFPYVAPFSSTVPDCCRFVKSFVEDSVSFMSYGGQLDFYDVVKKYLDRLLSEVLDEALVKLINTLVHGVSQAMQVAANMAVLERACDFFYKHAAQLCGVPLRMAVRGKRQFPLRTARDAAEAMLSGMLKVKIDSFMSLMENINWMPDEPLQGGNEYVNEVIIFIETLVSTAQQILPVQVLKRVLRDVLSHISEKIVGALVSDPVKRFNVNAVMGIDTDIRLLETFSENQAGVFSDDDASQLKQALAESRQLINLLLSNNPESFLNPVIRERSYNALDYQKVVIVSEKLKDPADRSFFTTRGTRQNVKMKSLDTLIKRLKEVS
ncbi:hypothetical protein Droror1_Dr00023240 [Drosera rotundifolia]